MATKRLPHLRVVQSGNLQFERFLIEDQKGRAWTGERFSSFDGRALYAKHNDAAVDVQNILKGHFVGIQPIKYVAPLLVEVYSDIPVHVTEVAQYLSHASRLFLNTPEHGHGPGHSLVLPWIEWHRIKEVKGGSHE